MRILLVNRFHGRRFWIDNRSFGVEGSFPLIAFAKVYPRCPTVSRDFLSAACAVNGYLMSEQRRVLTSGLMCSSDRA